MASLNISSSPSTTTNNITVNFTTDVSDISKVELSNDGGSTYISAASYTSSSAVFNVASWSNGTYNNCKLRLTYTETTEPPEISYTITTNLSNCTISNKATTITNASSYSATITANSGYEMSSIVVTMGDTDISSSAVSNNNINIGSVTGNIAITASATAIPESNPNILTGLVFGKGWSNKTSSTVDNPKCWATVDRISVTPGTRYRISCDAAWLWIRSFDDSDKFVSLISNGSNSNPSEYTFTATTPYIRTGCYDANKVLTYFKLEEV